LNIEIGFPSGLVMESVIIFKLSHLPASCSLLILPRVKATICHQHILRHTISIGLKNFRLYWNHQLAYEVLLGLCTIIWVQDGLEGIEPDVEALRIFSTRTTAFERNINTREISVQSP
jgi:hypothetical protein